MAPLENGGFQPSVWAGDRSRPVDSLMRALLYVAQQVGRPLSEADVRRMTTVPAAGLDEAAFLVAGERLGLETRALCRMSSESPLGVGDAPRLWFDPVSSRSCLQPIVMTSPWLMNSSRCISPLCCVVGLTMAWMLRR